MANEKEGKNSFEKIGPTEQWEDGRKVSVATPLMRKKDNKKGISIKIGSKVNYMGSPRFGSTIWIDDELNFPLWLNWFIKTVKKSYLGVFGKKITSIDEEVEFFKNKKEELSKQLAEAQIKLEKAEKNEQELKKTIELAKETKGKYKRDFNKVYGEFVLLIEESIKNKIGKEEEIKEKIKKENWLLGLECFVGAKNEDVDKQAEIDLHIKTKYNKDFIFEIKSPNKKPFNRKDENNKRRYVISSELSEALSEVIVYLRKTDVYSDKASEGAYGVQKAEGIVLMGANLDEEEKRIVKEINFHLYPHIQIITYDDLKERIKREIELLDPILENDSPKKI